MPMLDFFTNKRVLITGHTGFKGTWLSKLLLLAGADLTGYALDPPTEPNLFELSGIKQHMTTILGDIRDFSNLKNTFHKVHPEIVIHLAAQPIVRESYLNPQITYETNVMGTVNLLECIRNCDCVKSFLNVTTDKVYQNREWIWGYRENDSLDGYDPYSNSKSCSELITHSYKQSFFSGRKTAISTARAGNVIGGGDFAKDRIIPDCIRAIENDINIVIRNPYSIRPYQHVLEPLMAYLMIVQRQYEDSKLSDYYNVGPDDCDCITTGALVDLFCRKWELKTGKKVLWENVYDGGPHEATFLKLDCSKLRSVFGWRPRWNIENAIEKTVECAVHYLKGENISIVMEEQIKEFLEGKK